MRSVASVVDEMLQDGMKVIAVARKRIEKQNRILPEDEQSMILMGYLAFLMHPRKPQKPLWRRSKAEGYPEDSDGRPSRCGSFRLPQGGDSFETVLTGAQMDEMTDAVLGAAVEKSMFLRS